MITQRIFSRRGLCNPVRRMLLGWLSLVVLPVTASPFPLYEIQAEPGTQVQVFLEPEIYRLSGRSNLSDLVLLDSQGNRLPFRIQQLASDIVETTEKTPVPFYPVAADVRPESLRLDSGSSITLDERAIRIHIDKAAADRRSTAVFYLLDIREVGHPVTRLHVRWQPGAGELYRRVSLSGSRDLQRWTPLAEYTLVHMPQAEQPLNHNKIPLALKPGDFQFLRLTLLENGEALPVAAMDLEASLQQAAPQAKDSWTLEGQVAKDQVSQTAQPQPVAAWEFEREESVAITQLSLDMGERAYGDRLLLFSRANDKQPWQLIYRGLWYNTPTASHWQRSEDLQLNPNHHRHWRLELAASAQGKIAPRLVFSHPRQVMQFIANPFAPYTLALDRHNDHQYPVVQARILEALLKDEKPDWQIHDTQALNPQGFIPPVEARPVDWKTIIFWLVLALAVVVLITFAWRLLCQMRESGNSHP